MLKSNDCYDWCYRAIEGTTVKVAIVLDYPENLHDTMLQLLVESFKEQGYYVMLNYGSTMSYENLIKDINNKLSPSNQGRYVLFTRRSELISNEYGRPDTFFKWYSSVRNGEIEFGIVPFEDLTDRYIREANNLFKLYAGGTFELEYRSDKQKTRVSKNIVRPDWIPFPEEVPEAKYGNYLVTTISNDGKEKMVGHATWERSEHFHPEGEWYNQDRSGKIIAWSEAEVEIEPYKGDGFYLERE